MSVLIWMILLFAGTRRAVSLCEFVRKSGLLWVGDSLKTSHRDVFKVLLDKRASQGESGLVRFPLEKLSLFSPLFSVTQVDAPGCFAACGRQPGLLALDLASIFEKLLDQKTSLPDNLLKMDEEYFLGYAVIQMFCYRLFRSAVISSAAVQSYCTAPISI